MKSLLLALGHLCAAIAEPLVQRQRRVLDLIAAPFFLCALVCAIWGEGETGFACLDEVEL